MNLGTAQVIQGDARHLPLADNTVDLVVTSPPPDDQLDLFDGEAS